MGFLEFRNEDEGLTLKAVLEVAGEEDERIAWDIPFLSKYLKYTFIY